MSILCVSRSDVLEELFDSFFGGVGLDSLESVEFGKQVVWFAPWFGTVVLHSRTVPH